MVRQTLTAPRVQSMSLHLSAKYSLGRIPVVRANAKRRKPSGLTCCIKQPAALLDAERLHFLPELSRQIDTDTGILCEHLPADRLPEGRLQYGVRVLDGSRRKAPLDHPGIEHLDVVLRDGPKRPGAERRANM